MKRLFVILAALTLNLATQAQDKDKYEGLKKISPDKPKGSSNIIYLNDDNFVISLDDLDLSDLEDLEIDLSSLKSLTELSALSELSSLSELSKLEKLEDLEGLEELEDLEALEELMDGEFLEEIIEISLDASLKSLEALRALEVKPRKAQK